MVLWKTNVTYPSACVTFAHRWYLPHGWMDEFNKQVLCPAAWLEWFACFCGSSPSTPPHSSPKDGKDHSLIFFKSRLAGLIPLQEFVLVIWGFQVWLFSVINLTELTLQLVKVFVLLCRCWIGDLCSHYGERGLLPVGRPRVAHHRLRRAYAVRQDPGSRHPPHPPGRLHRRHQDPQHEVNTPTHPATTLAELKFPSLDIMYNTTPCIQLA